MPSEGGSVRPQTAFSAGRESTLQPKNPCRAAGPGRPAHRGDRQTGPQRPGFPAGTESPRPTAAPARPRPVPALQKPPPARRSWRALRRARRVPQASEGRPAKPVRQAPWRPAAQKLQPEQAAAGQSPGAQKPQKARRPQRAPVQPAPPEPARRLAAPACAEPLVQAFELEIAPAERPRRGQVPAFSPGGGFLRQSGHSALP